MSGRARKYAMRLFCDAHRAGNEAFSCCGLAFGALAELHRHASRRHAAELEALARSDPQQQMQQQVPEPTEHIHSAGVVESDGLLSITGFQLPRPVLRSSGADSDAVVLLFYHYVPVAQPAAVRGWQQQLCERLGLRGQVRIGLDGINGSVSGPPGSVHAYAAAMMTHPLFSAMSAGDFKTSIGQRPGDFAGLSVRVVDEIIHLNARGAPAVAAAAHLPPAAFHGMVDEMMHTPDSNILLLDCRNFYEHRIVSWASRTSGPLNPILLPAGPFPPRLAARSPQVLILPRLLPLQRARLCQQARAHVQTNKQKKRKRKNKKKIKRKEERGVRELRDIDDLTAFGSHAPEFSFLPSPPFLNN
jgi:hypothetical protein